MNGLNLSSAPHSDVSTPHACVRDEIDATNKYAPRPNTQVNCVSGEEHINTWLYNSREQLFGHGGRFGGGVW